MKRIFFTFCLCFLLAICNNRKYDIFFISDLLCFCSAEENFWSACDELTKYFKRNPSNLSVLMYPLGLFMKFSPRASLKVTYYINNKLLIPTYCKTSF